MSYVAAAERAISAAGHVIVDMADFPAADQTPAQVCVERVRGCEVYVGILGSRYGSPVRDRPEVSYTELEFDTATEAGLDRLVFMLDTSAGPVGIPRSRLIDQEFGARQRTFRQRVQDSELITQSFRHPAELGQLVERSLRDLADTRARLARDIRREQVTVKPQSTEASKFVNPPPVMVPAWFQDRQSETRLLAQYVTDPGIAMVTVAGRSGIGKTAMVCRLLKGMEVGRIPDLDGDSAAITMGGIVYLSRNGMHKVEYPTLVADLLRLLSPKTAQRLQRLYRNSHQSPAEMMAAVLEAFPAGDPVVVLLDNLESVIDPERDTVTDQALYQALTAVLTAPAHAVTLVATTRVPPTDLLRAEPARQRQLRLNEGLGSPDAEHVLRELDGDGHLGLRDAPEELLDGLRRHTRGFPRALEAVKAILEGDATLTPQELLDRTRHLPEDQVVQVLVGEAYELLDVPAQQVMQALAVYPAPVPVVGIDFLLQPVNPTTDAALILTRLVRRQLVQFQDRHYSLHRVDREYARGQLPAGSPGDPPAAFTLSGLQARAADYYAEIRTPRESWRTLDDLQPQLAEFGLRCDTGDYDTAAAVLRDIDYSYLQVWGHYRTVVGLHERIYGRISDPALDATHLGDLGNCHIRLSDYREAIDLYTQALAIAREIGDQRSEVADLGSLGNCHLWLGEYREAIDLHTQALATTSETGDRRAEGIELGNLGLCHYNLGEYREAIELLTEAMDIDRETGDRQGECTRLDNLGLCHYALGEYEQAIDLHTRALAVDRQIGYRLGEADDLAFMGLGHYALGEYGKAIDLNTQALAIARDIGYRYGEANALDYLGRAWLASGEADQAVTLLGQAVAIADTTGDIEPAVEARSGLARAYLQVDKPAVALTTAVAGRERPYPTEEPMLRLLEGLALLELHHREQSVQAFAGAVTVADPLLALADRNVAALRAKALALSGLAAATGDPARAAEAAEAFARARAVTTAAGLAADTRRLLDRITGHDQSGVLAGILRDGR
jgi:tetratricopeptide (TPR) repeat protein